MPVHRRNLLLECNGVGSVHRMFASQVIFGAAGKNRSGFTTSCIKTLASWECRSPADCLAGQGIEADDDMRSLQFLHDGILLISKDPVNLGIDGSAWKDLSRQEKGQGGERLGQRGKWGECVLIDRLSGFTVCKPKTLLIQHGLPVGDHNDPRQVGHGNDGFENLILS